MKAALVFIALILTYSDLCSLHVNCQTDSCNSNQVLDGKLMFNTSSLICHHVWIAQDFILRYEQAGPNLWSFALSAPNANAYIAIGFSANGYMVGSSAVVGWIASDGSSAIREYYLGGQAPSQVEVDKGNLNIVGNSSSIISISSRVFMGFQLNTKKPEIHLLYAIGPDGSFPGKSFRLTEHSDKTPSTLDYATGISQTEKNKPYSMLRKRHGGINMFGWGILMPIGAMVARYCKARDPLWFYAHISIQSVAFIFGVAGVAAGFVLEDKTHADVHNHKGLGIFILVLGCLQVLAFLARPHKDSKYRKYWNRYHYIVGRLLILLAAVNIFLGIHLGNAGSSWNIGYSIVLVVLFIITIILEIKILRK